MATIRYHQTLRKGRIRRWGERLGGQDGLGLIDALIGITLLAMTLTAMLMIVGYGWRTDVDAQMNSRVQSVAREMLTRIVHGDQRTSPRTPGLIMAYEVMTDPAQKALAYKVVHRQSDGTVLAYTITYYVAGERLYRSIVTYPGSLSIVPSGGVELAEGITEFALSPNGTLPVEITLEVSHRRGNSLKLDTRVLPRNLPTGG